MKCSRCSAEIPTQSQFCLRCGTAIYGTAANPSGAIASNFTKPAPNTRPLMIAIALLLCAVVGLGAVVVRGSLAQKSGQSNGGQLVQQPGQGGAGALVQQPGDSGANNVVQAPGDKTPARVVQDTAAPIPADINDYLRKLKQIELSKQALSKKQLAKALGTYGNLLPNQAKAATDDEEGKNFLPNIRNDTKDFDEEYNNLTAQFNQLNPPESCRDLHTKYYDQLGKIQEMLVKVNDALQQAESNPTAALNTLTGMMGSASAAADAAARAADDALADVCDKYHIAKDFKIVTDSSGSGNTLFSH